MAVPQINGSFAVHNPPTGLNYTLSLSAIADGSWMVVSVMSAIDIPITPPAGWRTFVSRAQSGTRRNYLYGKIKSADDGSSAVFVAGASNTISFSLLWGSGASTVDTWTLGSQWTRSMEYQPSGTRNTNLAPSVSTTINDSLALAISHETTLAMVQSEEASSFSPSDVWTRNLWLPQPSADDRPETIWIASRPMPTAGSTGDVTVTYTSIQENNGWAVQLIIPPGAPPNVSGIGIAGAPTTYSGTTNTSFTLNRPSGVQNGDFIVVAVRGQSSSTTVQPACPGFTRLGPDFVSSTNTYRLNGMYGHIVTDALSEPSQYTFTFTAGDTNIRLLATAFIVRGVNTDAPVSGFNNSYSGTALANGSRVESYNTADTPTFTLFMAGAEFTVNAAHTPTATPSGYVPISSTVSSTNLANSRTMLWVGGKEELTDTVGAASITWGSPTSQAAEGIALRSMHNDPRGDGYTLSNGHGNAVKLYLESAEGPRTPRKVFPMLRGFNSVTEMLAKPGFTWAHRGGSEPWPEMSLYAYTQSVARGYGVLEVSLARTSDGVWFGLHDQTTDRTSGNLPFGNASNQTWAQIQAQQIVVGGTGAPQPYMRWEEIVAAYGSTHLFVVDPKYSGGGNRTEFLNMVYNDIGPNRAIIKYSGVGSGAAAISSAAQAMGFQTWGFFYPADASAALGGSGALQTWGPSWTLIGMDHSASQAIWDEARAFGKPVIGHIAKNQTEYNAAMAKGAVGVQVAGVDVVAPVSWWTQ